MGEYSLAVRISSMSVYGLVLVVASERYIFCALHFDYISFVVGQYTRIFSGAYLYFPMPRCFTNKQDDEVHEEEEEAQQKELTGGGNFMFSLDFFLHNNYCSFSIIFSSSPF